MSNVIDLNPGKRAEDDQETLRLIVEGDDAKTNEIARLIVRDEGEAEAVRIADAIKALIAERRKARRPKS